MSNQRRALFTVFWLVNPPNNNQLCIKGFTISQGKRLNQINYSVISDLIWVINCFRNEKGASGLTKKEGHGKQDKSIKKSNKGAVRSSERFIGQDKRYGETG